MASVVITALGDDRAGLVDQLSEVVSAHDGNWGRSHMAELAGKFAGIVLVAVPDGKVEAFLSSLDTLEAQGVLDITAELAVDGAQPEPTAVVRLNLVGQDHPGIVHEVSHVLASHAVSIDELETDAVPAPQGGYLFKATARLELPETTDIGTIHDALEAVAADLMVDLHLEHD